MKATKPKQKESNLQLQVCEYLRYQYPDVLFTCDLASGMDLTIGQAVKAQKMRSSKGWPDVMIFEPRGIFHGLFLELKREGERIFKKDGQEFTSEHIESQWKMHRKLISKCYFADFAIGFNEAKIMIDNYLKQS